jgi:phage shock protein PspC (stress-responsive transcriptional regulator)
MNKTININLGGLFFHIDESAYQKLNKYLNSIRKSLSDDPQGRDEIIKDIEARISELLSEKVIDERQVVCDSDIDAIVKIMGQPEDYNVDDEIYNESTYIYKRKTSKKLFRDGDDKFLGGVASGTAHYIGIEPIWSRIIWLILAFATGFGFIAYPLLWILLPEAKSTSDKLEMEGESVNIDNIEKKIREEFQAASSKIKEGASEISDTLKKKSKKAKSGLQDFLDTIGTIILAILKIFAKFVGAVIIFFSSLAIIALVITLFSWGSLEALGISGGLFDFSPHFINTSLPHWLIAIFGFIVITIPFVVLFILGLKIISNNTNSFGKVTKLTLLAIWILAILGSIFSGIDIGSRYSQRGTYKITEDIALSINDTLSVSLSENAKYPTLNHYGYSSKLSVIEDKNTKKLFSTDVDLLLRKSETNDAYLEINKEAQGRNYSDSNLNAEKIEYKFNLNNTELDLSGYFLTDLSTGIFEKEIDLIIHLPEGYIIYLDNSTRRLLYRSREYKTKHYYIMGEDKLECLDCPVK